MTRKITQGFGRVLAGLAAVSMVAAAGSASADPYGRRHGRHDRDNNVAEAAIVAGVIGLVVGAAIASSNDDDDRPRRVRHYAPPPPPPPPRYYGYAPRPYYDGYGRDCWTTRDYDHRSGSVYERTVCR